MVDSGILVWMKALIDTHAHLCDPVFDPDRDRVLHRARLAGISAIIAVAENLSDAKKNLELSTQYAMIRPAAGLYPTIIDLGLVGEMSDFIRNHKDKLAAIGEIGLDYWVIKDEYEREIQREIFCAFINLGKELMLPLNIHSRSAGRHTIALLLQCTAMKVQLHAFDGKTSAALPAAEAGFFFSIPPSILRSEQKQKLVKTLPLESLLIETDSPVLGPKSGERNEPANALIVVRAIAELKGMAETEVIETIAENTRRLYGTDFS